MGNSETETGAGEPGLFPRRVGDRLRAARLGAGLDLNDIATRTRVPMRHLEAIERSDYAGLPSITYTLGFARSFARSVGLDPVELARDLRAELGHAPPLSETSVHYEPVDPTRVPSRLLAWTAAIVALLLLAGYLVWRANMFDGPANAPAAAAETAPASPAGPTEQPKSPAVAPAPSTTGAVVLTATSPVWVRIYDRHDKVLVQRQLGQGEAWPVPGDADGPMIRTGRADAIKVTIDGHEVAPLGPPQKTIRDVGISAAALSARAAPGRGAIVGNIVWKCCDGTVTWGK